MRIIERLKSFSRRVRTALSPSDTAWKGAAIGIRGVAAIMVAGLFITEAFTDFTWQKLAGAVVVLAALILAGWLVVLLIRLVSLLAPRYRAVLFFYAPLAVMLLLPGGGPGGALLAAGLLLAASLIGASARVMLQDGMHPRNQKVTLAILVIGMVLFGAGAYAIFGAGDPANPALESFALRDRTLGASNPGLPGEHQVQTLTYGTGTDGRRAEFGANVDLVSRTVDGSKLIDNWDGAGGWLRTRYWGFDETELPLQARVWYPAGEGPFPLVLIVHGNHDMEDFSDPGYGYLGELFASRGIILASVDENFLNGSIADLVNIYEAPGLDEENDARGWLLLEHLALWRDWNSDPDHFFYEKVDMDRLAVIGHSRGGEAVAVAAAFNELGRYPDDATLEFDFGFNLRGVIAIAPVDGQYRPRERGTSIRNVNYFTIHGSQDGDVQSFMGTSQYSRVEISPSDTALRFKSSLYVLGANHGQFNTAWGRVDLPAFWGWMLDTDSIMDPEAQRDVARVYFSAFLEVVLRDRFEYLPIFRDARYAAAWLPDTFFINQYADAARRDIVNFEEDIDPATTTVEHGRITGEYLTQWNESYIELKWHPLDTHVVVLAWDSEVNAETARYEITLPEDWNSAGAASTLTFSLSESSGGTKPKGWEPDEEDEPEENEGRDEEDGDESKPLDWTIVLKDSRGETAALPLSHDQELYPQIQAVTRRASFLDSADPAEVLLRRYAFRLKEFVAENPAFDPAALTSVCFVFDRSEKGAIVLDDLAIAPEP
jgi:hypothetical protein